jgi:hypothetical protein
MTGLDVDRPTAQIGCCRSEPEPTTRTHALNTSNAVAERRAPKGTVSVVELGICCQWLNLSRRRSRFMHEDDAAGDDLAAGHAQAGKGHPLAARTAYQEPGTVLGRWPMAGVSRQRIGPMVVNVRPYAGPGTKYLMSSDGGIHPRWRQARDRGHDDAVVRRTYVRARSAPA